MFVPSLDLKGGQVVQLVGGRDPKWASDDVDGWAQRLGVFGELALVDLDAAMGSGDNDAVVRRVASSQRCRVGGGVRDEARARALMASGADRLMVGTAATPELLGTMPRETWIACLDHRDGVVVDRGWTESTGESVLDRAKRLREHVDAFLVTNVGVEGSMTGPHAEIAIEVARETGAQVTAAGGVRSVADIVELHRAGVDAQVGMAIYTGAIDPVEAFLACLDFEKPGADGMAPTFVVDERGRPLMAAFSTPESLRIALSEQRGVYWSRSRNELWRKGDSSGHTQRLLRVEPTAMATRCASWSNRPAPHATPAPTRASAARGFDLGALETELAERVSSGGYTARLVGDTRLLHRKLMEEAYEVVDASSAGEREELIGELSDLIYHAMALMQSQGVSLRDVERALRARRRPVAKPGGSA